MKIKEIKVYGYGKLENIVIKQIENFTVFYGENEAGKSTIMSFIHSILFGFPTKQQSELRYEPKFHSKYGGQLIVDFPTAGKAIIERVKGRAAGDVTITLQDGQRGGEELLKEFINMDRATFQGIFSFNLQRIQNVHLIKNEDLNKFLFSTGAIGTDRLLKVENWLQKEMDLLFKPNGKKPLLNEMLKDIREADRLLQKAKQNNEQYWSLLEERNILQLKFSKLKEKEVALMGKVKQLQDLQQLRPYIIEKEQINKTLQEIREIQFPVDGLNRFKQLQQLITPYDVQLNSKLEKIQSLKDEMAILKLDKLVLERESDILFVNENMPLYERLKHEEKEWQLKVIELEQEIQRLKEHLHLSIDEEELKSINTSMMVKEKIEDVHRNMLRLKEKKLQLDERFIEERDKLESVEKEVFEVENNILSNEKRDELEKLILHGEEQEKIMLELKELEVKIKQLQRGKMEEDKNKKVEKKKEKIQKGILVVFFLLFMMIGFKNNQWLLVAASCLALLLLFLFNTKNNNDKNKVNIEEEIKALEERKHTLNNKLLKSNPIQTYEVQEQLAKDDFCKERLALLKLKLEQQNNEYEKIIHLFAAWEKEFIENEQLTIELGKQLKIRKEVAKTYLRDAFEQIVRLKELSRELEKARAHVITVCKGLNKIEAKLFQLANDCKINERTSIYQIALELKRRLTVETEKQLQLTEKQEKRIELEEEISLLKDEQERLQMEIDQLLKAAHTDNVEAYFKLGKQAEKRMMLSERLAELEHFLSRTSFTSIDSELYHLSTDGEADYKANLEHVRNKITALQTRLAEVKHHIHVLEEGGTYSDMLHNFMQKKETFNKEARNLARFAIAKALLLKTINHYKQERLPKILSTSEGYLQKLTNGEYVRILFQNGKEGFLIERKDHALFSPEELSQATAEQIYVALRLGLATTLAESSESYPIIIDDSFVNFDHVRTKLMIELLQELTSKHQVLFFTCHQHLLPYLTKERIVNLQEITKDRLTIV